MLPAISADLPGYLKPPSEKDAGKPGTSGDTFGPPGVVDISTDKAVDNQTVDPGKGLYGPDGRFVESTTKSEQPEDQEESEVQRELDLSGFEAAIPPAAREELRALADRVGRNNANRPMTASDYRQASRLYDRIGRHDAATEALDNAKALENPASGEEVEESEDIAYAESDSET